MNRAQFLKDLTGTLAVTVIGKRLNIIPQISDPLIDDIPIILRMRHPWMQPGDLIQIANKGIFYISERDTKLLATCINDTDRVLEIIEDPKADDRGIYKICEAI